MLDVPLGRLTFSAAFHVGAAAPAGTTLIMESASVAITNVERTSFMHLLSKTKSNLQYK